MLPLAGLRVVTLALNLPGPLAAAHLRAAGAAIVKIEPPGGDPLAAICPSLYGELHRDVAVERLDLKSDHGQGRLDEHLADAAVLLSSQRPAALARLRLGGDALGARAAHLRHVNIVGSVAEPERPGHDLTYQAKAGLVRDALPISLIADVMGAERAFSTVLLALGQPAGTHVQVGLFESLAPMMAPLAHGLTSPGGVLGGGLPAYGVYTARDGTPVAIAALEPHFRTRLYASLGLAEDAELTSVMGARTAAEWESWARDRDLPIAAVRAPRVVRG